MAVSAEHLVDWALRQGPDLPEVYQTSTWKNHPKKQEAYQQLQQIFSSPQTLASYVKEKGIQNLQNYGWWSNNPEKQETWDIISGGASKPSIQPVETITPVSQPSGVSGTSGASTSGGSSLPGLVETIAQNGVDDILLNYPGDIQGRIAAYGSPGTLGVRLNFLIQDILSSPEKLAQYAQSKGIQNLQNYAWWSSSPYKQDAWNIISGGQSPQSPQINQQTEQSSQNTGQAPNNQQGSQALQSALDIINNSDLPESLKSMYRQIVQDFPDGTDVNAGNVIKAFREIQASTINPQFQQLSKIAIDEISRAQTYGQQVRSIELETEARNADENIRNTQNQLENRGLTFSGESTRQLGQISAAPGVRFGQTPEGLVPQENRLISTSSKARFNKQEQDLQRQAELYLGTGASSGLVPGVQPLGEITGSLEQQKAQTEAGTLSGLAGQERQLVESREPITPF